MTFKEFQQAAYRTANKELTPGQQIINCALGLGESGEVQNIVKKATFQGHGLGPEAFANIKDELGDIMWYIAVMAEAMGTDIETIADLNIMKLKERYPEGFTPKRSIKRTK